MRIIQRLKIIWSVLFAKNFAYFQYDRAEFIECANVTALKNYFHIISPNEKDDINKFFGKVIYNKVYQYLNEEKE